MLEHQSRISIVKLDKILSELKPDIICFDLDHTLINSEDFYKSLEVEIFKHFGVDDLRVVENARVVHGRGGQAQIIENIRMAITSANPSFNMSQSEFAIEYGKLTNNSSFLSMISAESLSLIPGALRLVEKLRNEVELKITTNSRRKATNVMLSKTSLQKFFSDSDIICSDDQIEQKDQVEYWARILAGDKVSIGFEDNPKGVYDMINGGISFVYVRPDKEEYLRELREMEIKYSGRIQAVNSWEEIVDE